MEAPTHSSSSLGSPQQINFLVDCVRNSDKVLFDAGEVLFDARGHCGRNGLRQENLILSIIMTWSLGCEEECWIVCDIRHEQVKTRWQFFCHTNKTETLMQSPIRHGYGTLDGNLLLRSPSKLKG